MKLGEFLIANKLLDESAVKDGLIAQRFRKILLGRTLRDLGYLDQNSLNQILVSFLKPELNLDLSTIERTLPQISLTEKLKTWCLQSDLVPLSENHFIATTFQDEIIESGERLLNHSFRLSVVSEEVFLYLRNCLFQTPNQPARLTLASRLTDDKKLEGDNPYVRFFRECIEIAKKKNVSDIHIEPKPDSVQIRFRLHGDLSPWKELSKEHRDPLINKVKWLSNLDLSMSGKPQDSRATYYRLNLNLRVNAIPTRHGDKIVIRILDQDKEFDIHKAGLSREVVCDLKMAANLSNGLLIISGPTGSGKTTTLYGLINSLDHRKKNITTLEDPSEYELRGVTQTEIGKHLSFAGALKALLRQDPDVILLGEIRDEETAKLSFKIANTGHLVITTLHSNGALESIERLRTMGVDDYSIESYLRLTGAQRLLQELCPHCCESVVLKELGFLGPFEEKFGKGNYRVKHGEGCDKCRLGIVGRLPVMEYAVSSDVGNYLRDNRKELRTSLSEAAFKLAKEGRIDVREVAQIL